MNDLIDILKFVPRGEVKKISLYHHLQEYKPIRDVISHTLRLGQVAKIGSMLHIKI